MHRYENFKSELAKLLSRDDATILRDLLPQMQRLHSVFFTQGCGGCSEKQKTYLRQLRGLYFEQITHTTKRMEQNKFQLKSGVLARFAGSSEAWSAANITDDIAMEYLRINPNRIVHFKTYPNNWETLLQEVPVPEVAEKPRKKQEDKSESEKKKPEDSVLEVAEKPEKKQENEAQRKKKTKKS